MEINGDEFRSFRTVNNLPVAFNFRLKALPQAEQDKMKNIHLIGKKNFLSFIIIANYYYLISIDCNFNLII